MAANHQGEISLFITHHNSADSRDRPGSGGANLQLRPVRSVSSIKGRCRIVRCSNAVANKLIETTRRNSPSGKVRLFGEMFNILCGHNNIEAADNW